MNLQVQLARLKGAIFGIVVATGLITGGVGVANAVDPKQCLQSPVTAKDIRVVLDASKNELYRGVLDAVEALAKAPPDTEVAAWKAFMAKYGCLLGQKECDELFKNLGRLRADVIAGANTGRYTLEQVLEMLAVGGRTLGSDAANKAAARVAALEGAFAGQAFAIGTEKACKQCSGKLVSAGTREVIKKAGIGLLGASLGFAARRALGAYGYVADATQCGSDDMIHLEYTQVHEEFACQEAKRFDCPSRSKSRADCGMCCKFDLPTWSPSAQQQCEQSCKDKFPSKYCSNKAGQRIELKDQKNGTYQGECDSK
jgi:hypothetical protein